MAPFRRKSSAIIPSKLFLKPILLRGDVASQRGVTTEAYKPQWVAQAVSTNAVSQSKAPAKQKAPLATLPTTSLIRSFFINSISSKPWLLTPSISFLSFLCRSNKSLIFGVERNKLLAWIMKTTIYKQFCAGENGAEVKKTMKAMKDMGFRGTILTYARETVFDHRTNKSYGHGTHTAVEGESDTCRDIEAWRLGALDTCSMLGEGDQLALK